MAAAPIIASAPLTTGSFHARAAIAKTVNEITALVATTEPITAQEIPKPGASVSIRMTEPMARATMPPKPSAPNDGSMASAAMNATPRMISATPA